MKAESGIKIGEITEMICAYTEYLKNEHNLLVSIHFAQRYPYLFERAKALLKYNAHTNPYGTGHRQNLLFSYFSIPYPLRKNKRLF